MGWPKGRPRKKKVVATALLESEVEPVPVLSEVEPEPEEDPIRGKIKAENGEVYSWNLKKDGWGRQIITIKNRLGDIVAVEQRKLVGVEKQVREMVKRQEEVRNVQGDTHQDEDVSDGGKHAERGC